MTNPYAPPTSNITLRGDPRDAIKARVSRPATALIIMSSIQSVFVGIYLVSAAVIVVRGGTVLDDAIGLTIGCLQFICLILIAVGAAKLGFLESYRLARLGSMLACIPFITPFMLIGIPFGIWSLRLLSDPLVRDAFPDFDSQRSPRGG
ncbi:hypothetical protein Q31b_58240 [Novipirellula aureliae]|uniref:Uncharacterized protein n=1 Tax=Novipirellula aureliae TaxID=2527966 RepID=A0A5C6DBT8_9BACT|nr:hypothetical protein [Novipirellula aureliae]TWU32666.1 hypothetical protein Q31b_58240 [Novipirellula aureliae]